MLSIIIVTYNSGAYIIDCLKSILSKKFVLPREIIIVDNYSNDDTLLQVKNFSREILILENFSNVGYAIACNQGIKKANGSYILLLNPDTSLVNEVEIIFTQFLEKIENKNVWCVGAQLLDRYGKDIKSFGKFPFVFDVLFEQIGIKRILLRYWDKLTENKRHSNYLNSEVPYILGCDMFIRKRVLEEIGLFDERFFLNFEETELAWRANKAGYKCMLLPSARIIHYSGKSFKDLKSYLSHLWFGQLMFFKITQSKSVFYTVKVIHLFGSSLRLIIKLDKFYWIHFKKIWSIKL